MAKAMAIIKMRQTVNRGAIDANIAGLSWVHCSDVDLPGAYKAFVVTGTGAQLTALSNHANFLVGQQIRRNGDMDAWEDARTAIAAGAATRINTWLTANGYPAMTAQGTLLDLIQLFVPGYVPGQDDVADNML